MNFEDRELPTGVRLHVAHAGSPAAPALLLLHGLSDSWFSWSRVAPALARRFHVIAPDQRGHGRSERPPTGYRPSELAADAEALLDVLGIECACVAGHSLGSFVAQHLAARAPARTRALALLGGAPSFSNPVVRELAAALIALEDPVPEPFVSDFQRSTIAKPLPSEFFARAVAESLELPASVWRALGAGILAEPDAPSLAAAGLPLLVLGGELDAVFSAAEQAALAERQRAARLVLLADVGHAPHWEAPEQVERDLLAFFA